jgi:hypothetical protein
MLEMQVSDVFCVLVFIVAFGVGKVGGGVVG